MLFELLDVAAGRAFAFPRTLAYVSMHIFVDRGNYLLSFVIYFLSRPKPDEEEEDQLSIHCYFGPTEFFAKRQVVISGAK